MATLNQFKIELTIKELQAYVKSKPHNDKISDIVQEIEEEGCRVTNQLRWVESSHSLPKKLPLKGNSLMRISLLRNHPDNDIRLRVVWTIFHEYGHYKSGLPDDPMPIDERDRREILAWKLGIKMARKYFKEWELNDYKVYANRCLGTYNILPIKPDEWSSK